MKASVTIAAFLLLTVANLSAGKVLTRCQLAKELNKYKFPRSFQPLWVCVIEVESGRDTGAVKTTALSSFYGLFQIDSRKWCKKGKKGGDCNAKCEDFLDEDITDDVECAKLIYSRHGFNGWKKFENNCKQRPLPDISHCT